MSGHRVIETGEGFLSLAIGTVIIDAHDDVCECRNASWYHDGHPIADYTIVLPARVLLEAWER